MSMESLREALAENLSTIPGVQVSAYMLASPTPPAIHVVPGLTEYHAAFRNGAEWWEFSVQAFVASVNDIGMQKMLDKMLDDDGEMSVKTAIESDTELGGAASDLIVTTRTGYQIYAPDGRGAVLGAQWTVRVFL